jgi:hypothetical protein
MFGLTQQASVTTTWCHDLVGAGGAQEDKKSILGPAALHPAPLSFSSANRNALDLVDHFVQLLQKLQNELNTQMQMKHNHGEGSRPLAPLILGQDLPPQTMIALAMLALAIGGGFELVPKFLFLMYLM